MMPERKDISTKLIHFTKGGSLHEAFENLKSILFDGCINGGTGAIRGGYRCVCFTEAPLGVLSNGPTNLTLQSRYSLFGIMFDKNWIYARGGRPVIYQPEKEFGLLPEEMRWHHVRYEPLSTPPIDFTWEREWRVHTERLTIMPSDIVIVLPKIIWEEQLMEWHHIEQQLLVEQYALVLDHDIAEQYYAEFPFRITLLDEQRH